MSLLSLIWDTILNPEIREVRYNKGHLTGLGLALTLGLKLDFATDTWMSEIGNDKLCDHMIRMELSYKLMHWLDECIESKRVPALIGWASG